MTLNEKRKRYAHEYYLKNKEKYIERNKKWRTKNKKKFYELVKKSRKKRADRLREQGEMYIWRSEPEKKALYEKRNRRINQLIRDGEVQNKDNEARQDNNYKKINIM